MTKNRVRRILFQVGRGAASVAVAALAWEGGRASGLMSGETFPSLSGIASAFTEMVGEPAFWASVIATLQVAGAGLLIAVAIAIPLGILLGLNQGAFLSARAVVEFLKPIPMVAILPLAILIFGITPRMAIFLVAFGGTWPLLIQAMYGVREIDPTLRLTARAYKVRRATWVGLFVLPSSAPFVATGLRIAGTNALVLAVVTGLVAGGDGLGVMLASTQYAGAYARLYALVVVCGVLGAAITGMFVQLEKVALRWHPSQREA